MPGKRKSSLSQQSSRARAMKVFRSQESSSQMELRRIEQARRQAALRASETPEQAEHRRLQHAIYVASQRAAETPEQLETRREEQDQRQASLRAAETPQQAEHRRQQHAQYMASQRAAETPEQLETRHEEQVQRQASLRAAETPQQAEHRRLQHAHYVASQRAAETPEQLETRREEQVQRQASLRTAETPQQAEHRRLQHAHYVASQRAAETPEQLETRHEEQVQRQASLRAAETPQQAEHRRLQHAHYVASQRAAETPEQLETRHEEQVQRQATLRAAETPQQAEHRRLQHAHDVASQRAAETPEQLETRREEQVQRQASLRAAETPQQAEHRRQQHAQYLASQRAAETLEQLETRREEQIQRQASLRTAETPEQAENRRQQHAQYMASQRAADTVEQAEARRRAAAESMAQRRRIFTRNAWGIFERAALEYDENLDYGSHGLLKMDRMNKSCRFCGALKWKEETAGMCCSGGKVVIPRIEEPAEPLKELFSYDTDDSRHFLNNIRKYNACFHMTSFGADRVISMPGFFPTFTVQGQVYHRIGSLLPAPNEQPQFLQIYFLGDEQAQVVRRSNIVQGVQRQIIQKIQQVLNDNNILVHEFKTALENMPNDSFKVVIHPDRVPRGQHERRYNAPTGGEVAAVVAGAERTAGRDIVLRAHDGQLSRIADTHRFYDALQYPVIFWKGQEGYHFQIPQVNPQTRLPVPNKKVSSMDFYAYHLMVRSDNFNLLLRCKQLLQQFLVDMYVKIESERLRYISLNQTKLRAENYIHLQDAVRNDAHVNANDVGQVVILPSSVVNSPRYLNEYVQDAFAYVRNYGRPDLFITLTCNSAWKEITDELMPGQTATERHDLIARVFKIKVQKLVALLTKGKIFGETQCFMYSIEWQKRGLPHVHLLLWLKEKLRPNQIDDVISAEIPDVNMDKTLHDTVVKNMIHGPCGALNMSSPCMKDGKCTKKYPRALLKETQTSENGYPLYRRREENDGGRTATIRIRGQQEDFTVDNRWIVPYSPLLIKIFNGHINVEFCSSVQAIKYICKYINKGNDQAVFDVRQAGDVHIDSRDEVQMYRAGRYVSSNEAAWRILGLPLHERHPTVTHLAVHLPNGERVYFTEENFRQRLGTPPKTTLTAFFELCSSDNFAKTLLYPEVPKYYTWQASSKKWMRRVQGTPVEGWPGVKAGDALGRMYTVHVSNLECFCLRMLLTQVRGPTNFQALMIVDGVERATFREACEARGLLENDNHWDLTMEEAVLCRSASKLRDLFAVLVSNCGLSNPLLLWNKYKDALSEDIAHRLQGAHEDLITNEALKLIEDKLINLSGKKMVDFGLPTPQRRGELSNDVVRELDYDTVALDTFVNDMAPRLLPEQRHVYDLIMQRVNNSDQGLFFLDAPGGTGKTFVLNLLLAQLRKDRNIALAVASSGIAATLLSGGRTAHSTFKLPLNLAGVDTPTCNISKNSDRGALLQQCKLIVWDECTMAHKRAVEALNRSLQDIRGNQSLMGGVVVLLAGDFRQILPVIERGTPADEMNACLKASPLWSKVEKVHLTCNMRVQLFNDLESGAYAAKLLEIGEGRLETDADGKIEFTSDFCHPVSTEDELISHVFPDLQNNMTNEEWLCERAVLSPKNESVNKINKNILEKLLGDLKNYTSIDTVMSNDDSTTYPIEFLNSLELTGVPSHKLELKIGVPVLLMRNLDAPRLCNGTRLRVTELGRNIIRATILTGTAKGESVLIPRIPIIPNNMPFQFKRLQFPLKLAFSMTINKSQGQTLKVAGIHLRTPCFSHGQLYVGCSRVSSAPNLHVLAENNKSYNVVYRHILT